MKVYFAYYSDYDWFEPVGVYSSIEKAKAALRKRKSVSKTTKPKISEYELDKEVEE